MQSFEITIDGQVHPGNFATHEEAESVANTLRQASPGKTVISRPKAEMVATPNDGLGTVQNVDATKVLVQNDGIIQPQHGVVEGHGAAMPAHVHTATPSALTPSTAPAAPVPAQSANPSVAPAANVAPSGIPPKR